MYGYKYILFLATFWFTCIYSNHVSDISIVTNKHDAFFSNYENHNNFATQSKNLEFNFVQNKLNRLKDSIKYFYGNKTEFEYQTSLTTYLYPAIGHNSPSKLNQRLLIYPFHFFT